MYTCGKCGRGVIVMAGRIIRACTCGHDAPVIANMSATVYGRGGLVQGQQPKKPE